ncbi:hypothetical protein [Rufibacter radiotolerans]|nr:hypothetical protein [Rufibacter radiotolerans]
MTIAAQKIENPAEQAASFKTRKEALGQEQNMPADAECDLQHYKMECNG